MNITKRRISEYGGVDSNSWIGPGTDLHSALPTTLDAALFTANTHYPTGWLPSGTPLAKHTSTGLWGPYGGTSDEVQTITQGGSGLTSYTLTYSGQTTTSIAQAATAAQVQSALEALSNIAPGDVVVTGANGGPYTVTFAGTLADTNVAQMTSTPTGGTGTVTIATTTAGGADNVAALSTAKAFLYGAVKIDAGATKVGAARFEAGVIVEANLPFPVDAAGWTDLGTYFRRVTA